MIGERSGKGLVYTSFAILSSGLLLLMFAFPVTNSIQINEGDAARISEASFFMESVLNDMDRSLEIATSRALTGSTNYVVETGEKLQDPEKNFTSALVNGTISGTELNSTENATLNDWSQRVSDIALRSGYSLEIELVNQSFNSSGFTVRPSYSVFARLKDPSTLAEFNRTKSATTEVSIKGIEDSMILLRSQGRYISQYRRCGFDKPAENLNTGNYHSPDAVYGYAVVNPGSLAGVGRKSEKILAVDDVDSYAVADVNSFAGVVSAEPNSSTGYTNKYIFDLSGTSTIDDITQNMSVILNDDEVWRSSFREMFKQNCYVETDRGPGFFDRLGNNLVSPDGEGVATLIEVPRLPAGLQQQESAVGYVYFNSTGYGSLNEIRGVSGEHPWFRLDDYHVNLWGIGALAY